MNLKTYNILLISILLLGLVPMTILGCDALKEDSPPVSATNVQQATATVVTGDDGLTVEQRNITRRYALENEPGSIKHLYIISAYSGDVLIYSTVDGKVTSSGKRLSPYSVCATEGELVGDDHEGIPIRIGGQLHYTSEVLQDDGTYGSSIPYLFWLDQHGRYHQHYLSGGQILHISDYPITVGRVIMNLEDVSGD